MTIKTFIFALFSFFFVIASPADAQRMGIAAVVNDDIITHSDVEGRIQLGLRASNLQNTPEARAKLAAQSLDSLIDEQIRLQEAKRLGITVEDQQIEEAIDRIADQNNVEPDKFRQALQNTYGTLPSLKRQIYTQIAWSQVVRQRIRPQVNVTEADIDSNIGELSKNSGKQEYSVAEIFIRLDSEDQRIEKEALAKDLVKQLRSGASFPGIARQFSQGKEARNGGAIGWVLEGVLGNELDGTLKRMESGNISDPIKTDSGYHILFLRDKRIVDFAGKSKKVDLKQLLIPESDDVEALRSQATDCNAMDLLISAQGNDLSRDLGMVEENRLPLPVKAAITSLDKGQISEPVRAKEGFLILMVCGQEDGKAGSEAMRDEIANKIGLERLDRLQQRYLRDLRATAYIDVKN